MVGGADDLAVELAQLVGLERGIPVVAVHGTGEAESSCSSESKQKKSIGDERERMKESRRDETRGKVGRDIVRGMVVAGEVQLGPPVGHGRRPLLVRRLLL